MLTCSMSVSSFVLKLFCLNKCPLKFGISTCDFINKKYLPHSIYSLQIHRFFVSSNLVQNVHTVKGWKTLTRDGIKEKYNTENKLSVEEGTDAILHDILMKRLQECNTVHDQIETFCSSISLSKNDEENRKEFCDSLNEIFKPYFSEFRLNIFGSSINGLGFRGCDIDVSIGVNFSDQEYNGNTKKNPPPSLDAILKGEVSTDYVARLPPESLLRYVRRILRAHCVDIREPIILVKARWPLLRFYNAKYNVFCDFSCENSASLRNSKLIRFLCCLDERFSSLAKIIRYWGKYGGFVGDIDLFNSYSFALLVVHFLQLRNPPVLPPMKEIIEKSDYVTNGDLYDNQLLFNDLKKFSPSQNSQTVEELLREYFFHFLTFDYSQMMLPVSSSFMPKAKFEDIIKDEKRKLEAEVEKLKDEKKKLKDEEDLLKAEEEILKKTENFKGCDKFEFSTVTMQDPFRLRFNVTAGATFKSCKRFSFALIEACKAYQDENIWYPRKNEWGLCSLFQRIGSEPEMAKKWQENNVHTIKLPFETDTTLLIKIFQEALLFQCQDLLIDDRLKGPQPCFRLNCKLFYCTWLGRDWMYANHPERLTDTLEIENWVSNQISTIDKDNKKQLLSSFVCECFKDESSNEMRVNLNFGKSKGFTSVAIFLKEYVPSLLKKLSSKS